MKVIKKETYKNITVNYYVDKVNEDCLYVDKYGNVTHYDEYTVKREAINIYSSPKNTNKRKKQTFDVTVFSLRGGRKALNKHREAENRWVDREYRKMGAANGGSIFTMLKNKGF